MSAGMVKTRRDKAAEAQFVLAVDAFLSGLSDEPPVAEEFGLSEETGGRVAAEWIVADAADRRVA